MAGVYAGQALGGIGGYIADVSSWRNAFYWFGALGAVYAVFLLFELTDAPKRGMSISSADSEVTLRRTMRILLGSGAFLILVLYFTLQGIPGWAIKTWLPTHLATAFDLKQGPAGMSATGYVTIASLGGALLGGAVADAAARRRLRGRIYVSALGMCCCIPALFGLAHAGSLGVAIGCMMLFGLGFGIVDANNMPILCQIAPPQYRATGYGLMNMASIGTGAVVAMGLGAMGDRHIPLTVGFGISAGMAAIALLVILSLRPGKSSDDCVA